MSVDRMVPTRLAGRYVLRELIASGGMGEVHLATDERLGRAVAVKILARALTDSPESVERFRREALAAAGLSHPNIARVYDYGVEGDRHFIVMELLEGQSLDRVLRERGRLSPEEAVDLAAQVCAALAAAHRAGIVHRDVKPGNVVVAPDGTVKVTDFGISKALGASPLTDTGTILGTAAYLPPEVGRGASAGAASDLYSLGIVLYQMLTGSVPFTGDGPVAVAMRHVSEDVPAPSATVPGLPPFLDAVVARATRREPDERYPSAEAMGEALLAGDAKAAPAATAVIAAPPEPTQAMTRPLTAPPAPVAATAALSMPTGPQPGLLDPPADQGAVPEDRNGPRPRRLRWGLGALAAVLLVALGALGASVLTSGDQADPAGRPANSASAPPSSTPSSTPTSSTPQGAAGVVPDGLVGSDLASAEAAITKAGLSYQWRMVASDAPRNQVIEATPSAGEKLGPGDAVQLVVSRGKPGDGNAADTSGKKDKGKGSGKGKAKGGSGNGQGN